jgi:hypothetical protein
LFEDPDRKKTRTEGCFEVTAWSGNDPWSGFHGRGTTLGRGFNQASGTQGEPRGQEVPEAVRTDLPIGTDSQDRCVVGRQLC